jgi:hypothetical protein
VPNGTGVSEDSIRIRLVPSDVFARNHNDHCVVAGVS